MIDAVTRARDALLAAEAGGAPGELPVLTPAEAYRVQAAVLAARGTPILGWKAALIGGEPAAAPITAMVPSGAILTAAPGRTTRIETELAFRLGLDLPPSTAYVRADIVAAIAAVHPAFEIVGARLGEPPAVPFAAFLADRLGNAGLVVGEALADDGAGMPARAVLTREGREIAAGPHPHGDPLATLLAWANARQDACGGLRAGQFVITGSFTGAPAVEAGATYRGCFEGGGCVAAVFRSASGER